MITDTLIRSLLPATFAYGIGDTPLIDRIRPHIPQAEYFIYSTVCPARLLAPYLGSGTDTGTEPATGETTEAPAPAESSAEVMQSLLDRLIATQALWSAIPMLDLTLSPTGFAVGSTDSLQPASASRVKELRANLLQSRDLLLLQLLQILPTIPGWTDTPQAENLTASILTPQQISDINTPGEPFSWASFRRSITILQSAQTTLAGAYISHELMERLRSITIIESSLPKTTIVAALTSLEEGEEIPQTSPLALIPKLLGPEITPERYLALHTLLAPCRRWITATVAYSLDPNRPDPKSRYHCDREILDTVSWIREHPELYPEWHTSATAVRYSHKPFRNDRRSGGYFF